MTTLPSLSSASIDYTSKDYDGFKSSLLDFAARRFPDWKSRSESDFGVLLVELFSYMGDILSYYGDRIQMESFLPTATQRLSLLYLASLLGYTPSNGTAATGTVTFATNNPGPAVVVPAGTQVSTNFITALDGPLIFETTADITVPANGGTATADVVEGVTYKGISLGTSNGLESQTFRIPYTPIIDGTVVAYVQDVSGSPFPWVYQATFVDAEFSDFVFTTYTDEQGATWVKFGDGINGAIPANGLAITVDFRVGGGARGNLAAGTIANIVTENLQGVSIQLDGTNTPVSSATTGGSDPESNDQIRSNAPLAYRSQQRAVTLDDYASLALNVGFVAKANAIANHYSSVTVYVANSGITVPTSDQLLQVAGVIQPLAMAGTTVTVLGPTLVAVDFGSVSSPVVLQVLPRFSRSQVQLDVTKAFQALFNPENVDFGMRLALSDVMTAISSVPGVQYVQVPVMVPSTASHTTNNDIIFRPGEIPTYGTLQITASGGV